MLYLSNVRQSGLVLLPAQHVVSCRFQKLTNTSSLVVSGAIIFMTGSKETAPLSQPNNGALFHRVGLVPEIECFMAHGVSVHMKSRMS